MKSSPVTQKHFDMRFDQVDQKFHSLEDKILTKLDGIVKELEDTREDRTLGVYQTREIRDQVEDHEKRILKLEKSKLAS